MSTNLLYELNSLTVSEDCEFNGTIGNYLKEYSDLDPILKEALEGIVEIMPTANICTGIKCAVNHKAISNQIIRYKDISKLEGKALTIPYLIYAGSEDDTRGLLVVSGTKYGYIYAKGFYYCMTEPGGPFIDCKNDIVATDCLDAKETIQTFKDLLERKAGAVQRYLDNEHFPTYEDLKTTAMEAGEELKQDAYARLASEKEKVEDIHQYVIHWFLLKKVLYVQYMVNKSILRNVHDNNVRKQRNQAKTNADEVSFLSMSEMWSIGKKDEKD